MYLLSGIFLISCDMWPLLMLGLAGLFWLLGWLFGRSKVRTLNERIEKLNGDVRSLNSQNDKLTKDVNLVKSDYERTNKGLLNAKNKLSETESSLKSSLSKFRMIEVEKNNLVSEKNALTSENQKLVSEKNSLVSENKELGENSLNAADANISNKAIADLQEKLTKTERALADCESSKIVESTDRNNLVPPPSADSDINQLFNSDVVEDNDVVEFENVSDIGDGVDSDDSLDGGNVESDNDSVKSSLTSTPGFGFNKDNTSQSGMGVYFKEDNLQIMEGVGPKIESLLKAGGFDTWNKIADASDADLQKVLDDAGPRYRMHNPGAWSKQAMYARNGEWDQLVQYQKDIDGDAAEASSKAEKLYFKGLGFAASKPVDLKVVEGIGPKIESLLKEAGIQNWKDLSNTSVNRLQDILTAAGDRYRLADPGTWPKQAELAAASKWTELKEYQDFLSGGKA